jgi:hypothetical protein
MLTYIATLPIPISRNPVHPCPLPPDAVCCATLADVLSKHHSPSMPTLLHHAVPCTWPVLATLLLGCPNMQEPLPSVTGSVVDAAGNAVKPTRVEISIDGGLPTECRSNFGSFVCPGAGTARVYTLTLTRGDEVYTDAVSEQDGCRGECLRFRPFTVETAPDGACSPDTLPLVARVASPRPGTLGALERLWMQWPAEVEGTLLPSDALGTQATWADTQAAYVQEIFAEPGLPADEALSLYASVRANGTWCRAHGGWSGGMRLDGRALIEFLPRPSSEGCGYEPVELSVGPDDLVDCYNISR